jgi:hypothetical protein
MEKSDDLESVQVQRRNLFKEELHHMSIQTLLKKILLQGKYLFKKEIDLAKNELKADIKSEALLAGGFSVGIIAASVAGILLLVTIIFLLSLVMPGWIAGLVMSGIFLLISIIAFVYGWGKRVKDPFVRTKEVLKADSRLIDGGIKRHAA